MKWIGGFILMIITMVFLVIAIFMFPWYTTKTVYERDYINREYREYWDDNLDGMERDWDESTFYLQNYELRSSNAWDWGENGSTPRKSSGTLYYNSEPSAGGWDGSAEKIDDAGYPKTGFLPGGTEQLTVYNYTYYFEIISTILAIVSIIFVILAGIQKIRATIAKIIVVITAILVVIGPIYFAIMLPFAIDTDCEEIHKVQDPFEQNKTYESPAEADGIWGTTNEKDPADRITATTDFTPGLGWWMAICAIFSSIITLVFISDPNEIKSTTPEHLKRKYHELDKDYTPDQGPGYGDGGASRSYDRSSLRETGGAYDYHGDDQTRRQPSAPPRYDYGRPPPRRPRHGQDRGYDRGPGSGYPPSRPPRRRQPRY